MVQCDSMSFLDNISLEAEGAVLMRNKGDTHLTSMGE